jgi:hypothetical protein
MADGIDWKAKAQELEHALEQAKEEFEVGNVGMIPHVFLLPNFANLLHLVVGRSIRPPLGKLKPN